MRISSSHTALFWQSVTMLIQTLREGECIRVTIAIIWCLLGCEQRSLTVYWHFEGLCSIRLRSRTFSTLKLCKHNCYPTRRRQIPKYTVPFTVTVVTTSPLTLTLKQHATTAYGGTEVKLLSSTWRVNCQLQPPAGLYQGKKVFRCWMDSMVMNLGLVLASCKRGWLLSVSGTETRPSSTYLELYGSRHYNCRKEGTDGDTVAEMYQQFFQTYEWDGLTLPTLPAYR